MTPMEWIFKNLGKSIDFDGAFGPQCVDSINDYLAATSPSTGRIRSATAAQAAREKLPGWVWVANTPIGVPHPGSLVVWGEFPPYGIGPDGHIALSVSSDVSHLLTLDQNWSGARYVRLVCHDYGGVLGWHQPLPKPS